MPDIRALPPLRSEHSLPFPTPLRGWELPGAPWSLFWGVAQSPTVQLRGRLLLKGLDLSVSVKWSCGVDMLPDSWEFLELNQAARDLCSNPAPPFLCGGS